MACCIYVFSCVSLPINWVHIVHTQYSTMINKLNCTRQQTTCFIGGPTVGLVKIGWRKRFPLCDAVGIYISI